MNISLSSYSSNPTSSLIDNTDFATACFNVAEKQIGFNNNGDFQPINKKAIVRTDTNEALYVGSPSYRLVKNSDILLGLEPLFDAGYRKVKVRNIYGKRFMFELVHKPLKDELLINGMPCATRIRVINSYDGTTQFGVEYGVYIQVCSNGLLVNMEDSRIDFKYKHTKFVPEEITDFILRTTIESEAYLINKVASITFDSTPCDSKLSAIAKLFPAPAKQNVHPIVSKLLERANQENQEYKNENFALMMALTNMATFPDSYGIAPSYVEKLEEAATNLFTV